MWSVFRREAVMRWILCQNSLTAHGIVFMPERENDYMTVGAILKKHSIFDMDIIFDKYPKDIYPFDFDTYFSSETVCEIVATNARTGKAEYFQEKADRERLMKICRASSSMPMITPMVDVDGGFMWTEVFRIRYLWAMR